MKPVCGSDGKTYNNKCLFEIAKCKDPSLRIIHAGRCADDCDRACPSIYRPLCGSDGKTYSNGCFFEVAKCKNPSLFISHKGECYGKEAIPLSLFY